MASQSFIILLALLPHLSATPVILPAEELMAHHRTMAEHSNTAACALDGCRAETERLINRSDVQLADHEARSRLAGPNVPMTGEHAQAVEEHQTLTDQAGRLGEQAMGMRVQGRMHQEWANQAERNVLGPAGNGGPYGGGGGGRWHGPGGGGGGEAGHGPGGGGGHNPGGGGGGGGEGGGRGPGGGGGGGDGGGGHGPGGGGGGGDVGGGHGPGGGGGGRGGGGDGGGPGNGGHAPAPGNPGPRGGGLGGDGGPGNPGPGPRGGGGGGFPSGTPHAGRSGDPGPSGTQRQPLNSPQRPPVRRAQPSPNSAILPRNLPPLGPIGSRPQASRASKNPGRPVRDIPRYDSETSYSPHPPSDSDSEHIGRSSHHSLTRVSSHDSLSSASSEPHLSTPPPLTRDRLAEHTQNQPEAGGQASAGRSAGVQGLSRRAGRAESEPSTMQQRDRGAASSQRVSPQTRRGTRSEASRQARHSSDTDPMHAMAGSPHAPAQAAPSRPSRSVQNTQGRHTEALERSQEHLWSRPRAAQASEGPSGASRMSSGGEGRSEARTGHAPPPVSDALSLRSRGSGPPADRRGREDSAHPGLGTLTSRHASPSAAAAGRHESNGNSSIESHPIENLSRSSSGGSHHEASGLERQHALASSSRLPSLTLGAGPSTSILPEQRSSSNVPAVTRDTALHAPSARSASSRANSEASSGADRGSAGSARSASEHSRQSSQQPSRHSNQSSPPASLPAADQVPDSAHSSRTSLQHNDSHFAPLPSSLASLDRGSDARSGHRPNSETERAGSSHAHGSQQLSNTAHSNESGSSGHGSVSAGQGGNGAFGSRFEPVRARSQSLSSDRSLARSSSGGSTSSDEGLPPGVRDRPTHNLPTMQPKPGSEGSRSTDSGSSGSGARRPPPGTRYPPILYTPTVQSQTPWRAPPQIPPQASQQEPSRREERRARSVVSSASSGGSSGQGQRSDPGTSGRRGGQGGQGGQGGSQGSQRQR